MILLIDNYDSFSYNLFQMIGDVYPDIRVIRNDAMSVEEIAALAPDAIVLSPGPGKPADAGVCIDVVRELSGEFPILGVCLGHQAIFEAFGGVVTYAPQLMHGKSSEVEFDNDCRLFEGIQSPMTVARYHSLAADPDTLPEELKVVATAKDGTVMAVQHMEHPTFGVQFHPESILTNAGSTMLQNFVSIFQSK